MQVNPIGIVHSPFKESAGTPIQPAFAKGSDGVIEIYEQYGEGLKDLEGFERIWVLSWFDRAVDYKLLVKPYMDNQIRGLFSTRAPARPNPIGLSCVKLDKIEGNKLFISELDMLDGTPVLDIKPYNPKFDFFEVKKTGWLAKADEKGKIADSRFEK